jgi:hypothetical protein
MTVLPALLEVCQSESLLLLLLLLLRMLLRMI